jgi:hypothetical protein
VTRRVAERSCLFLQCWRWRAHPAFDPDLAIPIWLFFYCTLEKAGEGTTGRGPERVGGPGAEADRPGVTRYAGTGTCRCLARTDGHDIN